MDLNKMEECYEKCRAIISVLDRADLDVNDRATLIWIAKDIMNELGEAMGIGSMK